MDATHIHLLLNHFPIFATIIAFFILVFGIYKDNRTVRLISYLLLIVSAVITIIVFQSGENVEHVIEKLIPNSKDYIEEHEDIAKIALWFSLGLGVISIIALICNIKNKLIEKRWSTLVLSLSIISIIIYIYVGNLGGKISHSELRDNINRNIQHSDFER